MEVLSLLLSLLPYAVAAGLGLALPLLILGAYNSFGVGLSLIAATAVLEAVNQSQPILRIGLMVYTPDVPMLVIGAAAGLRWLLRDDVPRRHPAWVLLALVFFAGLAIGLGRNGTTAGVQARPEYYAIAAATYAMSFPLAARQVRQLVTALTAMAVALLLLSVYRWVVYYTPIPELLPPGGVYNVDGASRVIGSHSAMVLANVLVVGLFFASKGGLGTSARWLSPLLLSGVVVLQHRSVWLAVLMGVLLSILLARTQRAPLWQQLAILVLVATTAIAPIFFSNTLSEQVQTSISRGAAGQGTVDARFANWRSTIDLWLADGPRAIAMGREFGSDTARLIDTEKGTLRITFNAHNQFVSALTNLGVLGFGAMLWVFSYVSVGLWRLCAKADEDSPVSALLLVLIGMQLIYYVAYTVDYTQYLVLGVAVAWVAGHQRTVPHVVPSKAAAGAHRLRRSPGA